MEVVAFAAWAEVQREPLAAAAADAVGSGVWFQD